MRIAALVVVAAAVGIALWLILGHKSSHRNTNPHQVLIQKIVTPAGLRFEARTLARQIYWAGQQRGARLEFTEERNGALFVRYLTHNAPRGIKGANYLIVASYKFPNAYNSLKKLAKTNGVSLLSTPDGGIVYVRPHFQKSVLMAWPKLNLEVEVYDPSPIRARQIATSGDVKPISKS